MDRTAFCNELRKALSGYFSPEEIQDTVEYYEDYIDRQMQKGKSESEVLEALGDPRLLAKSMIAAGKRKEKNSSENIYPDAPEDQQTRRFRIPVWLALIVIILVIIILFSVMVAVIMWVLPIALIASACYLGFQYFIKNRKRK